MPQKQITNSNLIYKYAPVNEYTYKNLILKKIWFNPPNLMNDRLEGLIKIKNLNFSPSKVSLNNFIRTNNFNKQLVYEKIEKDGFIDFYMTYWFHYEIRKFGMSCFSKKNNEALMWAHYADKHKGICLVYDKKILLNHLQLTNYSIVIEEVNYKTSPTLILNDDNKTISYRSDLPLITTKDKNWKYEQEVRFLLKSYENFNGESFPIGATPLKGIIYGYNIPNDDKLAISDLLLKDFEYSHVDEYDEEINYKNGKIEIAKS